MNLNILVGFNYYLVSYHYLYTINQEYLDENIYHILHCLGIKERLHWVDKYTNKYTWNRVYDLHIYSKSSVELKPTASIIIFYFCHKHKEKEIQNICQETIKWF